MMRSLAWKLTLAFLLVALTVALLVAAFLRLTSSDQLTQLIIEQQRSEYKTLLITYYQTHSSWEGVQEYVSETRGLPFPLPTPAPGSAPFPGGPGARPDFRRDRHSLFGVVDAAGLVVVSLPPDYPLGGQAAPEAIAAGQSIEVNGQVVGTILTAPFRPGFNPEETAYLRRTYLALALASGGAVLVALLMGVVLARTLVRPLQALTQATHRMAGGALEQEVAVRSRDEIGELATAFNRMSREVARANNARRQMTADVAHELRTPLTVIAGYVESMRDGALPATPERLAVIYSEVEHLQHLVGDLRTLAQADTGELKLNRQRLDPAELLEQARAAFEHQAAQKGVKLELILAEQRPAIWVDEVRLAQVLSNLVANALRYTPAGGRITLGAASEGEQITLSVRDTGPGIAAEELPRIFNRFYRTDKARSDEGGESGLGLAIVKALVEAHGGAISVESTPGQGATFMITLPMSAPA